jgi:hypothetical protein
MGVKGRASLLNNTIKFENENTQVQNKTDEIQKTMGIVAEKVQVF